MMRVAVLVALLECTGCAAPRTHFQQPRLVVGAQESEWANGGESGARVLRPIVFDTATTLVWVPLATEDLLEAVSLGEVDAGLVRQTEWMDSVAASAWIEASSRRNGYHLLVGKGARLDEWIARWEGTAAHEGPAADPHNQRPE